MIHYERINEPTRGAMRKTFPIKSHDLSINLFGYAVGVLYQFKHGSPKLPSGEQLLPNERRLKFYYRRPDAVFYSVIERVCYWNIKADGPHWWRAYRGSVPLIPTDGRLGYL